MLATAVGLVFTGGTSDRKFHAFDATTGKLLWEFPMNSGGAGAAVLVLGRWQAIHRRRVGLGWRLARHAGDAE
jgi:hypothetical protein